MTATLDVSGWLHEQLTQASPDLLRATVSTFAEALMGAEADAVCGAPFGDRSSDRTNTRNSYRRREWDTRAGSIELAIPKLRQAATSRIGCWNAAAVPRRRWSAWSRRVTCSGCPRGGWSSWSRPRHHPVVEVAGLGDGQGPGRAG